MKNFHFWVKYGVFIKNKNTHGLMTIFNKCSKFQNDIINIRGDMTS